MAKRKKPDNKTLELKRTGTINSRPDSISDALFRENPFFDPKHLLQLRYEMLRRHDVEGISIVDVATRFGGSRPTFYQTEAGLQHAGCRVLMRCGLATWAQLGPSTVSKRLREPLCELPTRASPGAELIRLLASLILSTRQEKFLHV